MLWALEYAVAYHTLSTYNSIREIPAADDAVAEKGMVAPVGYLAPFAGLVTETENSCETEGGGLPGSDDDSTITVLDADVVDAPASSHAAAVNV
jgi:hypothetical protein